MTACHYMVYTFLNGQFRSEIIENNTQKNNK